jgi:biopolymer transport protein TolQ
MMFAINPFFTSYVQSDAFGKLIFISLIILSIISWAIIIYKFWLIRAMRKQAAIVRTLFEENSHHPLNIDLPSPLSGDLDPYGEIYKIFKKNSLEILGKNRLFCEEQKGQQPVYLSSADIDLVATALDRAACEQSQLLDKNLFMLSTSATLAPFLGLLGTVWGILVTFSGLQAQIGGGSSQAVLSGLSLALATTVVGLLVAIPALVGYNFLKTLSRNFSLELGQFASMALACLELQYRKVDLQ